MTRVGRIPYINTYPVYGAVDRGLVPLEATLVDGVPTVLNRMMAEGTLDVSVVSAVEYARDSERYLLLPDLAISCDGPVRSVMLFASASRASGGRGTRTPVSLRVRPRGRVEGVDRTALRLRRLGRAAVHAGGGRAAGPREPHSLSGMGARRAPIPESE